MGVVTNLAAARTVRGWQKMFRGIYHRRNAWMWSATDLTRMLAFDVATLGILTERESDDEVHEAVLALVGMRLFSLADFLDEDLAFLLARKYNDACPSCGAPICRCPVPDSYDVVSATDVDAEMLAKDWMLDDAQRMLARIYGERNARMGTRKAFYKLNDACSKLGNAVLARNIPAFREKIADACAWWLGLVTLSDIPSTSDLLFARYPDACPRCRQIRCECAEIDTCSSI